MSTSQRAEQKKRTRKRLIEVAIGQLAQDGLTTARTADIAKAASVSHGTVFAHFPTREELLIAVIEEFGSRVTDRLHELVVHKSGVRTILEAHLQGLIEVEPFYTRLVIEGRLMPDSARNALVTIQSAISHHLNQAVEEEMRVGNLRPFPIHLVFNTWVGLVHYYLANNDLFADGGSVLKKHGQTLIDYYMSLLRV